MNDRARCISNAVQKELGLSIGPKDPLLALAITTGVA